MKRWKSLEAKKKARGEGERQENEKKVANCRKHVQERENPEASLVTNTEIIILNR